MLEQVIVIEDASLEIVPDEIRGHDSCKLVERRFNTDPSRQILDDNFHGQAMRNLHNRERRGRPDVVHFALLDITSTPLYTQGKVSVFVHTINDVTIILKNLVRLPRTLNRFEGVFAKILAEAMTDEDMDLFDYKKDQSFNELVTQINPQEVVSLSKTGSLQNLKETVTQSASKRVMWTIGGFPFGHFDQEVVKESDQLISISKYSLPAHVVTARLCYELESIS